MSRRRSSSLLLLSAAPLWLGAAWLASSGITCAAGTQNPITTGAGGAGGSSVASTSSGPTTASSSSTTTTASTGGSTTVSSSSAGGAGGVGGATTTTTTTTTTGTGGCTPGGANVESNAQTILTVLSSSETTASSFNEATMMGSLVMPYNSMTQNPMGLAFTGTGLGVLVLASNPFLDAGPPGELLFAVWNGSWSGSFGQPMLPVQMGTTPLQVKGGPSLAGGATKGVCTYQGLDSNFYFAEFFNGSWAPTNEPIPNGATQSTGPVPPGITALGDDPTIVFVGNDGELYDQTRSCGTWGAPHAHGVTGHTASVTPTIIALPKGPELLIVYDDASNSNQLMYTTRTSGVWSAPAAVSTAQSSVQVALTPLLAGGAALAYEGLDGHPYTSLLSAGAAPTWSMPIVPSGLPTLLGPPQLATGPAGFDATLAYVETAIGGTVYQSQLSGGVWSTPTMAGLSNAWLAIATGH